MAEQVAGQRPAANNAWQDMSLARLEELQAAGSGKNRGRSTSIISKPLITQGYDGAERKAGREEVNRG